MDDLLPITLDQEIDELKRELRLREVVYARLIEQKRLKPQLASRRMRIMESAIKRLEGLKNAQSK